LKGKSIKRNYFRRKISFTLGNIGTMEKLSPINKQILLVSEIQKFFSKDIIDTLNNGKKFNRFGKIYSFTNENIDSYYDHKRSTMRII